MADILYPFGYLEVCDRAAICRLTEDGDKHPFSMHHRCSVCKTWLWACSGTRWALDALALSAGVRVDVIKNYWIKGKTAGGRSRSKAFQCNHGAVMKVCCRPGDMICAGVLACMVFCTAAVNQIAHPHIHHRQCRSRLCPPEAAHSHL